MAAPARPSSSALSWLRSGLVAAACVAVGHVARLGLDMVIHGQAPFATFYPAVIAAGLLAGVRSGMIAVLLATPLTVIAFDGHYPVATTAVWCLMASVVAFGAGLARDLGAKVKAERDELARTQAKLELVVREQVHRAKNTLAVLTALANQSAQGASSVEDFRDKLVDRIRALSAAYGMLSAQESDAPLPLAAIVETALGPFRTAHAERLVIIGGPEAQLAPSAGIPLTLCLNELATNAVKYGALGPDGSGRVECAWVETTPGSFVLAWRERGGPTVIPPLTTGLGKRMIETALRGMPGGKAELRFLPAGVECDLAFEGYTPPVQVIVE